MKNHLTDLSYLKQNSYDDDKALRQRKSMYDYLNPQINLEVEIRKQIDGTIKQTILDIGCGYGDLLILLGQDTSFISPPKLYGIDIAQGVLAPAIEKAHKLNLNIEFKEAGAEKLPFPDNYFDTIICEHVLFHVTDIAEAVKEAYRCLKPGGRYIVTLNSCKSKPKLMSLRRKLSQILNQDILIPQDRTNVESFNEYLSKFSSYKLVQLKSEIQLTTADPYMGYLNGIRKDYLARFDDADWHAAISELQKIIDKEIAKKGIFIDDHIGGIFVAIK